MLRLLSKINNTNIIYKECLLLNINYELYKVFYYVAKNLSFSIASSQLFLSQSAVSQSIKTLEKNLNTTLFYRSTKKVTLTHEGTLLLKHIEPAINLIKSGENYISETQTLEIGVIHLGASDTICKYVLIPYLQQFHSDYPNIHIQVTNRTSIKCVDLLRQGTVDFIITNIPNKTISSTMNITEFHQFNDIFIAGNKFKNLQNEILSLEDLSNYPLLMLEKNTTTSHYIYDIFNSHNISIKPEVELGSIDLLVELTKINLGISFVPDYCVQDNLIPLKVKEVIPKRKLAIVTNKNIPLSFAAKKFISYMV